MFVCGPVWVLLDVRLFLCAGLAFLVARFLLCLSVCILLLRMCVLFCVFIVRFRFVCMVLLCVSDFLSLCVLCIASGFMCSSRSFFMSVLMCSCSCFSCFVSVQVFCVCFFPLGYFDVPDALLFKQYYDVSCVCPLFSVGVCVFCVCLCVVLRLCARSCVVVFLCMVPPFLFVMSYLWCVCCAFVFFMCCLLLL